MLRIIRYLKPYLPIFFLTIVLLFAQANADLALPDYMSRIVNNGIQQGGVEDAVPEALRAETMDKLTIFMSAEDKALVLESYTLVPAGDVEYLEDYPILADEAVYVRNEISKETREALNPIIAKSLMAVSGIQMWMEDPSAMPDMGAGMAGGMEFDPSMIPAGMDIFDMLKMAPPALLAQLTAGIDEQFETLGESMAVQMAVVTVKSEYETLGMDTEKMQSRYIVRTGAIMLLISLGGGVSTVAVGFLAARTAAGVARDIRKDVFEKVESFSNAEFNQFSSASLITRSTNDVTQLQMVTFMVMRMVFYAPIIGVGGVIRAVDKSPSMWWIIALAVAILLVLILVVFWVALPKFQIIQSLIDRLNLVVRENLSGMLVIRAFNKQKVETDRFDKANLDLTDTSLFVARVMVTMMPIMMLVMNGLSLLIIWIGSHQIAEATMQVGDMMAFLQYAMQIVFAFLMLTMMFIFLPRAAVSGARVADVLETEVTIHDPEEPKELPADFSGKIEFHKVSFKYPDAEGNILHDISFTALPGQTTAFIGSTGCGKSTVINLIPRFYDVTEGCISVDGVDIRDLRQHDLRDKIGYVPQQGTLFSGSIESNLRYADEDATDDDLMEAAQIAQASEFIDDKEEGLEAEIAQGGTNVSGGQKQRLSIARALVKKPPIFIFDDSFSALDFKTASALRRALQEKTAESTVLIVTQRVATVKNADKIIVLDEGRVLGEGVHADLMESCETYREIALSQLSEEELS